MSCLFTFRKISLNGDDYGHGMVNYDISIPSLCVVPLYLENNILVMMMMVNNDHNIPLSCVVSLHLQRNILRWWGWWWWCTFTEISYGWWWWRLWWWWWVIITTLGLFTYTTTSLWWWWWMMIIAFPPWMCHICDGIIVKFLFMYVSNICCRTLLCLKLLKIKVHDTRNMGNECRSQRVICCDILSSWGIPESDNIAVAVDVDVDTYWCWYILMLIVGSRTILLKASHCC